MILSDVAKMTDSELIRESNSILGTFCEVDEMQFLSISGIKRLRELFDELHHRYVVKPHTTAQSQMPLARGRLGTP